MKRRLLFNRTAQVIHDRICEERYRLRSVMRKADFTRLRKMGFTDYIYMTLQNTKTSLQAGLNAFLAAHKQGKIEYSKQAFSKGRQRIKPEAFQELFYLVVESFYENAELSTWNGYHLLGIDGTRLNLPCTDELAQLYGTQITGGVPQVQALVSCVYDLLNGMIIDTRFAPCKSSERDAALDLITSFWLRNIAKPVFVMDRGYPSAELIDAIDRAGHKFVMRCSTEFLRAMKLPQDDTILEHRFLKLKHSLKLRVLKIRLDGSNVEYLVTNIFDPSISAEDFKWVYNKRWSIETKYNDVKNKLEIENFTGYSPIAILQDFYATMFLADLAAVSEYDLRDEIEAAHAKPGNRYKYQMNIAMVISELKQTVVEMVSTDSAIKRNRLFKKMTVRLSKAVVPVRPNRSSERQRKHKSMKFPVNSKRC